jgi:hypothetical protein
MERDFFFKRQFLLACSLRFNSGKTNGLRVDSCEHGNKPLGWVKGREFL